ncbi:hypothetical protein L7D45_21590 [Brucella pseudogrignonensis]|uniref:hypothetical protein n=1 Tax=Brucella pseudogrignonensis TaxID=419475 RepID=UPI00190D4BBD|nr:hypothetical protein [Brucella pseudogrignonensis]MBK0022954.1 hypothetical protein [Ochrobactrum sp. S45]MBK0044969.1 hypothetical protein [Ochrobactrum sp. S46]UKK95283.1 hypothetical protein L7D45_21590 [Brucella pseudogrignonensis]
MDAILYLIVVVVAVMALNIHFIGMGTTSLVDFFGHGFGWGTIFGMMVTGAIALICQRIEARK